MSQPSTTTRATEGAVELTEFDRNFGITAEKKKQLQKEYPHLKEL